jgi:hypothetical protein
LEDNQKVLKQCARWSRSNWRSNLTSLFKERYIWYRQPWSAYAVHLTTLSPPALLGDMALVYLCHKATEGWDRESYWLAIESLLWWMLVSKFIKLLGHYIRHPVDIFLLPISILFGYFHGVIKMYAVLTLNVTAWGSRAGADANDAERMRKRSYLERQNTPFLFETLESPLRSRSYPPQFQYPGCKPSFQSCDEIP